MPTSLRKIIIAAGLLCLIVGGFLAWKAAHPPLTEEQLIYKNLTAIQDAAQDRQTKTVAYYLARDFSWGGTTRQEFVRTMSGAFFQARDIQIALSNVDLTRSGDTAETSGNYSVSMRMQPGAPLDNARGTFKLYWRKTDGDWKVYKAEGGTNIGG